MRIKKNNILTVDKYIYEALYNNKSGYYMKGNPFGKSGDYITAPNISILFSEMIAIWIILFWENLKRPKKFNLIELGAGNGEMMKQIIKTFERFLSFKNSCKINILEKSIYLKKNNCEIWGLQYHPEITYEKMIQLINFRKDKLINYRKVFNDENQINEHIAFIKKEISRSNKEHRMLELKNWLQGLNGN